MKRGFTLVELSIVLVIIGLLIGGILVAQSMIGTVKTQRLVRELQQYEISINLFGDRFKQLPGDFSRGAEMLGAAVSGNGDGMVNCCFAGTPREQFYVSNHMFLAGLMNQEYKGGDARTYDPTHLHIMPGINTPATSYKGVGLMLTSNSPSAGCSATGGIFNTSNCIAIAASVDNTGTADTITSYTDVLWGAGLNAPDTLAIDVKLDDGLPNQGNFRSVNAYRVSRVNTNTTCRTADNLAYLPSKDTGCRSSWIFQQKF